MASLPQIESLLALPAVRRFVNRIGRSLVKSAAITVVQRVREEIAAGGTPPHGKEIADAVVLECRDIERTKIRRTINGTGVVLHTNLGRAPLDEEVWDAARKVNCRYSSLEMDIRSGKRGGRNGLVPELLSALAGCEDALVVNNNAAAVFLILSVFGSGREVVVSRGEQIQIGGGFRIPEILKQTGSKLVEVGTTNITTVDDFADACTPDTGLCLRVHTSNYAVRGFTRMPGIGELKKNLPAGIPVVMDQGSGTLSETVPGEIRAGEYLKQGADLVCFSADKVFGGPQAGIILGRAELISRLTAHPLMRVFRPGKTVYSLLEEHCIRRTNGRPGYPGASLLLTRDEAERTAVEMVRGIPDRLYRIVDAEFSLGGGSSPDEFFPTAAVELTLPESPQSVLKKLRCWDPPIIGIIQAGRARIFPVTLFPDDVPAVNAFLKSISGEDTVCT